MLKIMIPSPLSFLVMFETMIPSPCHSLRCLVINLKSFVVPCNVRDYDFSPLSFFAVFSN